MDLQKHRDKLRKDITKYIPENSTGLGVLYLKHWSLNPAANQPEYKEESQKYAKEKKADASKANDSFLKAAK